MSFAQKETSNYSAEPISLYEFTTESKTWRYCSDIDDYTLDGNVYIGVPASDSGMSQSGEAEGDGITITLPRSAEFATLFQGTAPAAEIWATVRRVQHGEQDAPVHWIGTVSGVKDVGASKVEITCNILTASFNRLGLRLTWGRQCPHALYDRNCRVNKAAFGVAVQVQSLTGVSITAPGLNVGNGYFTNGFFEWQLESGLMDRRPIESHTGNTIVVLGTADGVRVGDWLMVYPGCARTTAVCDTKFNNLPNYGGIPHLPGKSPFDGLK